ncbi:MAG: SpoIIE family protein phosphatase, partial [Actinomycetota bacterium]|nr:SpoIIE family protein phosphatase [Actinomycetota bacterium]
MSADGTTLSVNRRFAEVWGLASDALDAGQPDALLTAAAGQVTDPAAFLAQMKQADRAAEGPRHDEVVLTDGRVLDCYGAPLHDGGGAYLAWAWYFRDVSAHKRTEAELRRLAETLQASLLPPRPPQVPGMQIATRYRPAGQASPGLGGDFFDVFRLRSNDWGLVIGDVCGKGAPAASLTALARYSLRAAAVHNEAPADVLRELNDALLDEPDLGDRFCSVVFARLELDVCGAWVTLACGGHPQPIVVRRAGWIDVRGQPGMLLGLFDDPDLADDRVGLGPGDALVFCTDGITEARDAAGEMFADEALPTLLLGCANADAQDIADLVVAEALAHAAGDVHDDVAVLVVRVPEEAAADPVGRLAAVTGAPPEQLPLPGYRVGEPHWGRSQRPAPPREARLRLANRPSAAGAARRFVAGVLHSWRMSELTGGDVELLTSEVVTNALRHGQSPLTVIVRYDGHSIRVEVGDGSRELPRRRQPSRLDTGGRGLQIVDLLAAAW